MKQTIGKWLAVIIVLVMVTVQVKVERVEASSVDNAVMLITNAKWSKDYYITENDNDQWFQFSIPSDGRVEIKVIHYSGIAWGVYTQDLANEISGGGSCSGTEISPKTDSKSEVLSKGVYFLNVYEWNNHMGIRGGEGKYRINISFESFNVKDDNAISYDNAQQYVLGTDMIGAITLTDTEDWYCFTIRKKGHYNLKVTHYFGIQINVYNEDLSETIGSYYLPEGEALSPKTDSFDEILFPGTYFLKISESYNGIHGGEGKYTFMVSHLTPQNCTHDYNTSYIAATYFRKGYTLYTCKKCGNTYKGQYTGKKKLEKGYISMYSHAGKRKLYLQWNTQSNASGYQIRYCKTKSMKKGVKIKLIKGRTKSKKTIKKLSRKKKYYVQVRAYKKSGKKIVYGKWSAKKCLKTR